MTKYTIGLDYGSDSVRSLIVSVENGEEVASAEYVYPRWAKGLYCNPIKNQFRQHPLDYLEGLEYVIIEALKNAPSDVAGKVVGISMDTTGSTPVAVDKDGTPLALTPGFETNPNAMFLLWKDHTAVNEADEINSLAAKWDVDFTAFEGGVYSSEWFWSKILHVIRTDDKVYQAAYSWVEHCDWISAVLTGNTDPKRIKRSRCTAGHKAMWHENFDGLPSEEFLEQLDPKLKGLRGRLYKETYTCEEQVGVISKQWAKKLGLPVDVVIGVGAIDCHFGAIGAEIEPYYLSKVMGTSTCDIMVVPNEEVGNKLIKGICGQVDGSVLPGMLGMEAGQSAYGDLYAWFINNVLMWPVENVLNKSKLVNQETRQQLQTEIAESLIVELSKEAEKIETDKNGVIAMDWVNGRRTPDANQKLKGAITGLSMGTNAASIFRSLVEATAFGSKAIVDRFVEQGVPIKGVIALGGVAKKSKLVMQVLCDVLNMPIKVARSEQACALGAAMAAAVAAGVYGNFSEAQQKMGCGFEIEYVPIIENAVKYQILYDKYKKLGHFIEQF